MSAFPAKALQAVHPRMDAQAPGLHGAVVRTPDAVEYAAIFGACGIVQQAKEGFIAARFSPNQALRMKRRSHARREQPEPHAEVPGMFCYIMPFESALAA